MDFCKHSLRVLAALAVFQCAAYAQTGGVPPEINYQGYYRESGMPVIGNRTMKFCVTDAADSVDYWCSSNMTVAVSTGLFNVTITPAGVDWAAVAPYIEVTVAGVRLGSEKVASSIYALHASTAVYAESVSGISSLAGNIGVGTTAPGAKLHVDGTFKLVNGSQGAGKVLSSDVNGLTSWITPVSLSSTQTFTGENTFSNGVFFSSIIQSVGGNTRGSHAVDLQTDRALATQVASGADSVVGGGYQNTAAGIESTVSGGRENIVNSNNATIGGGYLNTASGPFSTIPGGEHNTASGQYSIVAGGIWNSAAAIYSFAAGYKANSTAQGAFTWADSEGTVVDNNAANRTWFKNKGGFQVTASTNTADGGLFLTGANQVGVGTTSPQGALDVASTTGAFIVPRMTAAQRDALTPVNGMIIYNTDADKFNFREGGAWVVK